MNSPETRYLNIGPRLTLIFVVLIALILGGNTLLIWQFHAAHLQTDQLTGVSQQMIEVLRLQESLLAFHRRLDELAQARDAGRLAAEEAPLRTALLEQIQRTRSALPRLVPDTRVDPAFLPTLETIEIALPSQLEAITALAATGDWQAVRLRVDNEMKPLETQTSALVNSIDQEVSGELTRAVANMSSVQRRIIVIVPMTAIATFLIASFFGWAITRRLGELRLEERVGERMRIARDLHDTLLQSFQGLLLKFHAVTRSLHDRPEIQQKLEGLLEQGQQAVIDGRDAVVALRSSTVITNDLARAFAAVGEDLAAKHNSVNQVAFQVEVAGATRDLHPILRDEVYRIAREALRNAFQHSGAARIVVSIHYGKRQFRVCVEDNGKGIDPKVLAAGGRQAHYGLPGMHERAKLAGGKLVVKSRVNFGTEAEISIPAALAYAKPRAARQA